MVAGIGQEGERGGMRREKGKTGGEKGIRGKYILFSPSIFSTPPYTHTLVTRVSKIMV